ncbi:MAG TPA: hypothetical protein DEF42_09580 [Desulfosporosinus sp.]|nr:hypothetical protein [Desulfosporosinus sp.]
MSDILKIQKTVRKSIKDYAIAGKYEEEALIALISVDLWLILNAEETNTSLKPKTKTKCPDIPKDTGAQTAPM